MNIGYAFEIGLMDYSTSKNITHYLKKYTNKYIRKPHKRIKNF